MICQNRPESSRTGQNFPESARIGQGRLDSARIGQSVFCCMHFQSSRTVQSYSMPARSPEGRRASVRAHQLRYPNAPAKPFPWFNFASQSSWTFQSYSMPDNLQHACRWALGALNPKSLALRVGGRGSFSRTRGRDAFIAPPGRGRLVDISERP